MKLTRQELLRAKDIQLHAVGLNRSNTKGWLQKALAREFTEEEIQQFKFATKKKIVPQQDKNVTSVQEKMGRRAKLGLKKYGVTTERTDLSTLDWLNHAQQEAMDLAVYLEKLIQDEIKRLTVPVDFHSAQVAPYDPDELKEFQEVGRKAWAGYTPEKIRELRGEDLNRP